MSGNEVNRTRRNLIIATSVAGGVGAVAAAVPFVVSMMPSARAKGLGAPVEADISKLEPGAKLTVKWRGKPVWIISRTKDMIDGLSKHDADLTDPEGKSSKQPPYAKGATRSIKPEIMVMVGLCTHLGCSPSDKLAPVSDNETGPNWNGGFYCPCHGSRFDLSGRVYKGSPAPINLEVPPYQFLADGKILIGDDGGKGA